MTIETDECLATARSEVQRLLGKCVLQLQGYEHLTKAILTHHRVSGSAVGLEAAITARADEFGRQTLGNLAGKMLGTFIVDGMPQALDSQPNEDPEIEMRLCIVLSSEDFAKAKAELEDFVALRNRLVHHFFDDYELRSQSGCEKACLALGEASEKITMAWDMLKIWAGDLDKMKSSMADLMQTPEFRDFHIEGKIPWPKTMIVQALREAEIALARDGWAPVLLAEEWLLKHHPDEQPDDYRCRSWRQVIHETRLFDLKYLKLDGRREAWFRSKG